MTERGRERGAPRRASGDAASGCARSSACAGSGCCSARGSPASSATGSCRRARDVRAVLPERQPTAAQGRGRVRDPAAAVLAHRPVRRRAHRPLAAPHDAGARQPRARRARRGARRGRGRRARRLACSPSRCSWSSASTASSSRSLCAGLPHVVAGPLPRHRQRARAHRRHGRVGGGCAGRRLPSARPPGGGDTRLGRGARLRDRGVRRRLDRRHAPAPARARARRRHRGRHGPRAWRAAWSRALRHLRERRPAARAIGLVMVHRVVFGIAVALTVLQVRGALHPDDPEAAIGALTLDDRRGRAGRVPRRGEHAARLAPYRCGALVGAARSWSACTIGAIGVATGTLAGLLVDGLFVGFAGQAVKVCSDTIVQEDVDDDRRGRVFSLYDVGVNVAIVVGLTAAAFAAPGRRALDRVVAAWMVALAVVGAWWALTAERRDPARSYAADPERRPRPGLIGLRRGPPSDDDGPPGGLRLGRRSRRPRERGRPRVEPYRRRGSTMSDPQQQSAEDVAALKARIAELEEQKAPRAPRSTAAAFTAWVIVVIARAAVPARAHGVLGPAHAHRHRALCRHGGSAGAGPHRPAGRRRQAHDRHHHADRRAAARVRAARRLPEARAASPARWPSASTTSSGRRSTTCSTATSSTSCG